MEVTKAVAPTTGILVGDTVTFTVQASNNGPNAATGGVVTDLLPAGLSFVSASATQGTYTDSSGQWVISALAAGQSVQLTIQAQVTQPGNITATSRSRPAAMSPIPTRATTRAPPPSTLPRRPTWPS